MSEELEKEGKTKPTIICTKEWEEAIKGYDPKRSNRFMVEFPQEYNIPSWSIRKINKPKFIDGKWKNIHIEFYDTISPSISHILSNAFLPMKKHIYFKIKTLDPTGVVVEEWVIISDRLSSINFGDFDYDIDEPLKIHLTITPSNCILTTDDK
jgi:hypothetical protein